MSSEILAIIPARGGSKGIPRKNVQLLAGKPLVVHSIEHALAAQRVTRVVVSTDDEEIAAVSRAAGAEVIRRPAAISGDEATSESALAHALEYLREGEGYEPELVVFLQATSPLRQPQDVDAAVERLIDEDADSLFSAHPTEGFIWRREDGRLRSFNYDYRRRTRRQDSPVDYVETGSFYIFKPWVLFETDNRLGGRIALYETEPLDSFQIDEPPDLIRLEQLAGLRLMRPRPDLGAATLLVLDFDGVLTDNRVLVHQDGSEAVFCHRGDSWGIARLRETGMPVVVLSTETNPVVQARCDKLGLPCYQGSADKLRDIQKLASDYEAAPEQTVFVGNDVNDLAALRWAGFPVAVADAHPEVLAAACWVTTSKGGEGAVREVCDALLRNGRRVARDAGRTIKEGW